MGAMNEYAIWIGENIENQYPTFTWEQIMDLVARGQFDKKKYSIDNYLNETDVRKERRS